MAKVQRACRRARLHPADSHTPASATTSKSLIDVIKRLASVSPKTSVVVLTMEEDRVFVRDALDASATGCVQKLAAGRELVRAIRAATAGSG